MCAGEAIHGEAPLAHLPYATRSDHGQSSEAPPTYEVGRARRPARITPWLRSVHPAKPAQKGQSGNPSGRQKGLEIVERLIEAERSRQSRAAGRQVEAFASKQRDFRSLVDDAQQAQSKGNVALFGLLRSFGHDREEPRNRPAPSRSQPMMTRSSPIFSAVTELRPRIRWRPRIDDIDDTPPSKETKP